MSLVYVEYSADPDADQTAWDTVMSANPSAATGRITPEFTAVERDAMSADEFARERLGIFPDADDEPRWLVIEEAAWTTAGAPAEIGWLAAPRLALEVAPDFSEASIVAGGRRAHGGGDGVELVDHRPGIGWVVPRLVELLANHGDHPVVIDEGSPADVAVTEALLAAGVDVLHAATADVVKAATDLILGVGAGVISHPEAEDQAPLTRSVAAATLRTYGDVALFDRRLGAVIGPVIAASLALWGARQPVDVEAEPEFLVI